MALNENQRPMGGALLLTHDYTFCISTVPKRMCRERTTITTKTENNTLMPPNDD